MTSQTVLGYTDRENIKRYERSGYISYIPIWKNKRNSRVYDDVKIQFEHSHIMGNIADQMQTFNSGGMIHIDKFNTVFSL